MSCLLIRPADRGLNWRACYDRDDAVGLSGQRSAPRSWRYSIWMPVTAVGARFEQRATFLLAQRLVSDHAEFVALRVLHYDNGAFRILVVLAGLAAAQFHNTLNRLIDVVDGDV